MNILITQYVLATLNSRYHGMPYLIRVCESFWFVVCYGRSHSNADEIDRTQHGGHEHQASKNICIV
jgi:hypothetical protein